MYDEIYISLFEIVSFFNRPKQDKTLLKESGVLLDTALFPLLMRVGMHGSLGIVELSEQVDRDYSTVSRQVDKLLKLELVVTKVKEGDKRVRLLSLSKKGTAMVRLIAAKRRDMMAEALSDWSGDQLKSLQTDLDHLAKTLKKLQ